MINIQTNAESVVLRLDAMPQKLQERLSAAMTTITNKLRSYIMFNKLSGQVLNVKTGDLKGSIGSRVESSSGEVTGTVFSSGHASIYGRVHEYGMVFNRDIYQAFGKKLKDPLTVTFNYSERSFMRSSLSDQNKNIVNALQQAVKEGIQ